jgi:hypothetical protein
LKDRKKRSKERYADQERPVDYSIVRGKEGEDGPLFAAVLIANALLQGVCGEERSLKCKSH